MTTPIDNKPENHSPSRRQPYTAHLTDAAGNEEPVLPITPAADE